MQGISNERWAQVQRVLDGALALPPELVAAFLDRECDGDVELRRGSGRTSSPAKPDAAAWASCTSRNGAMGSFASASP